MTRHFIYVALFCALAWVLAGMPLAARAQNTGPMAPRASDRFPAPPPAATPEAPAIPPQEIIRRFAAKEDEMARAIAGYSFQKDVRIQEIGPDNKPTGQLEIITQEWITPDGKMMAKSLQRPASTLHQLDIQRGDSDLLAATPLFPLTTSQLAKYEISFGGLQPLDELSAYFFSVKPRALDRVHAYFSGTVWVDATDLVIVKMIGKWITETGDVTSSVLPFTVFETYRQQVGKNLWFPAYSRSDDTADIAGVKVPVRAIVRWSEFKPSSGDPGGNSKPQ
jgi:hypothetical protein